MAEGVPPAAPQGEWGAGTIGIHADAPSPPGTGSADDVPPSSGGTSMRWSHSQDVAAPIGVTTTFESVEGGHIYSRQSNPTRDRCECVLAALEATPGATTTPSALLYSSGLAAVHAILVALLPETKRIAISGGYHGTHQVLDILKEIRPSLEIIQLPPVQEADTVLQEGDVVWLETPRNPMCEVYDIAAYSCLGCQPKVVVDSTFAPPPIQRCLALGATAVMHSTTKYLAGHSDALGEPGTAALPCLPSVEMQPGRCL